MKLMKVLALATLLCASAAHGADVKTTQDLLAAMQAEKMLNSVASGSGYANPAQREAVYAKIAKVPPAQIYARLATPVSKLVSNETATEMTRFYNSPYGKKVIYGTYNTRPTIGASAAPVATPAERKDMKRPEFIKAQKELDVANDKIRHEVFVLLQAISKAP